MMTVAKWALGILPAGITLGALLGAAANPDMKDPPEPWWRLTGHDAIVAPGGVQFVEAGPEDLYIPGGYRPDLDYDAEVWALPIPASDLAFYEEPYPPSSDDVPSVTYINEAPVAEAADEAEAAAQEAVAAQAPPAEQPAPASGPRKSELALAGLY